MKLVDKIFKILGYSPTMTQNQEKSIFHNSFDKERHDYFKGLAWDLRDFFHHNGQDLGSRTPPLMEVLYLEGENKGEILSPEISGTLSMIGTMMPYLLTRDLEHITNFKGEHFFAQTESYFDHDEAKILTPMLSSPTGAWIELYGMIILMGNVEKAIEEVLRRRKEDVKYEMGYRV